MSQKAQGQNSYTLLIIIRTSTTRTFSDVLFTNREKILNFVAEMTQIVSYKENIDAILIKGKGYLFPDFSAQQLAERLGISPFTLSRVMRAEYGMSYTDVVHARRIQDAMRYLKDKRFAPYSIDDIGEMVGFKNRQSFFSAFKKLTGTTPERFRQAPQ